MTGLTWAETARLLRCTGFGTTGNRVDAASGADAATLLGRMLAADPTADPGATATPLPTFDPLPAAGAASAAAKVARRQAIAQQRATLTAWWTSRMLAVAEPFGERLTFAWHAVFATSIDKVRSGAFMATQNQRLRTSGRGGFRDLALTMLTDAAMLDWLDGETNTAAAPNENLAREFMELFSLGHGDGYTETDVREAARALTGWRITPATGATRLVAARHDNGTKTVLGVTGNLDDVGFCDAVLARPASAPFVLGRLWGQLVSDAAPGAATSSALVAAYGANRDLSAAITAMFTTPGFAAARGSRVVNPVDWTIGLARAVGVAPDDADATSLLTATMSTLGQVPFAPPSVGGWPSGQAWLSTAAVDARMLAAPEIVAAGSPAIVAQVADASPADRVDAVAHQLGVGVWSNRSRAALAAAGSDPSTLLALGANTPEYLTI